MLSFGNFWFSLEYRLQPGIETCPAQAIAADSQFSAGDNLRLAG
jgi:hypothetical protein